MEKVYFIPTELHPHVIDSYPYGRLRCIKKCWLEFVRGKGARSCEQTQNPKNGRWNAIKKSTYTDMMVCYLNDDAHLRYGCWSFLRSGLDQKCRYSDESDEHEMTGEKWLEECNVRRLCAGHEELEEHLDWCLRNGRKSDCISKYYTIQIEKKMNSVTIGG